MALRESREGESADVERGAEWSGAQQSYKDQSRVAHGRAECGEDENCGEQTVWIPQMNHMQV